MKQAFKRILSFLLSICIIVASAFLCPVSSYAVYDSDTSWWEKFLEESSTYLVYLASRVGAVVDHDFAQWWQTREDYKEWWNTGHISRLENSGGDISYSFDADLVAQIKQALIEYANETNGFKLEQTYPVNAIPASTFPDKTAYEAFKSYCARHAYTMANPQGSYMYIGDLTPYIKEGGGLVRFGSSIVVYNSDWRQVNVPIDYYQFKYSADTGYYVDIQENWGTLNYIMHYNPNKTNFKEFRQDSFIVTKDGGRVRVFNSASEFMNYDAGQRKVYFGKGFYDYDPSDITATWDEINDKIGRMDDLLQDLIDKITDNPNISEEELEELIDQLIDKIGEIGDKTDETNSILSGIASSLSGYFSSVLSYLGQILEAIKALVWIEADNKLEDDKSDLLDLIDKIWKDPETGSQEAADTLSGSFAEIAGGITKKFPFSIPWDIYSLFTVFSGTAPPDTATYRTVTLGVQPFTVDDEDLEQDIHEAPYFKLPLRIDSFRIYEEVVLDLKDFKPVSKLSRGLLSVLFAVFLIKFTMRIIDLFRGGTDD